MDAAGRVSVRGYKAVYRVCTVYNFIGVQMRVSGPCIIYRGLCFILIVDVASTHALSAAATADGGVGPDKNEKSRTNLEQI